MSAETAERQLAIESQRRHIKDIIKMFDDSDKLDSNVKKDIFEKMQAIQELGMPPEEVASKISVCFKVSLTTFRTALMKRYSLGIAP